MQSQVHSEGKSSKNVSAKTSSKGSVGVQPRIDELAEAVGHLQYKITSIFERFERNDTNSKSEQAALQSSINSLKDDAVELRRELKNCELAVTEGRESTNRLTAELRESTIKLPSDLRETTTKLEAKLNTIERISERAESTLSKAIADIKSQQQLQHSEIKDLLKEFKSDVTSKFSDQKTLIEKEKADVIQKIDKLEKEKVEKLDKFVDELRRFRWKFAGVMIAVSILVSAVVAYFVRAIST
ncbi:hypothetical protein [Rheinheimera sp.]|uniref:hypothetical protein n=1 Tax=Rheinheimera sp. TaxID=1869214 RepID=UPI003D2B5D20